MDSTQKWIVGIAVIALVAVLVLSAMSGSNASKQMLVEGKDIINRSIYQGAGLDDYSYAYMEVGNGYPETYLLAKNGNVKYVETDDILSVKKVYFLENDTILCVNYLGRAVCSSTKENNDTRLQLYYNYLLNKFFDKPRMEEEGQYVLGEWFDKGYVVIHNITDSKVEGHPCRMLSYSIDLSNITVAEATKYGISLDAPKHFDWEICADKDYVHYKRFTYTYRGKAEEWKWTLDHLGAPTAIVPPTNLTDYAYDALVEEMQYKGDVSNCFMVSSAEERERCIATKALDLTNTRLCELSGTRRDRCLVSIVALKLNESICTQIRDLSFKDDCYIEMAGGKKDAGYCANILDASKKEFCLLNASVKSNVTAIANPAAVNCRKEGYDYEIRKDNESNEYGICMYNGKECDEWALYRKECCLKEGDCAPGYDCIANACITNSTYNQTRHDQIISEILAHSENSTNKTG